MNLWLHQVLDLGYSWLILLAKLSKSSPFGEAKPRDENEILRKKEEERRRREEARLQREKEEIEKQRLEEEPPLPLDAEKQKPVEAEVILWSFL